MFPRRLFCNSFSPESPTHFGCILQPADTREHTLHCGTYPLNTECEKEKVFSYCLTEENRRVKGKWRWITKCSVDLTMLQRGVSMADQHTKYITRAGVPKPQFCPWSTEHWHSKRAEELLIICRTAICPQRHEKRVFFRLYLQTGDTWEHFSYLCLKLH